MSDDLLALINQGKPAEIWYRKLPANVRGLLIAAVLVWALEIIDLLIPGSFMDSLGVRPRSLSGLIGVPLMPFLHGGLGHLISNTLPFLILGWIVSKGEEENFLVASIVMIVLGGLGTWLIAGKGEIHIGASGLVYGYFGYVMARAIMAKRLIWIVTGIAVGLFFGSMIFGAIPGLAGYRVSWEGHLCGMLAGAWFGWRRSKELSEQETASLPTF